MTILPFLLPGGLADTSSIHRAEGGKSRIFLRLRQAILALRGVIVRARRRAGSGERP